MDAPPIIDIIRAAGGAAKLACECGVDRTTPYSWRQVPVEHLATVARVTGFTPAALRPDLAELLAQEPAQ